MLLKRSLHMLGNYSSVRAVDKIGVNVSFAVAYADVVKTPVVV